MRTLPKLLPLAVATALVLPAGASAHDAKGVKGERTPAGTEFAAPVPAFSLLAPVPTFSFTVGSTTVDTKAYLPPSAGLSQSPGWYVLLLSGATAASHATVEQHCPDGSYGLRLTAHRASPGGTASVLFDAGERGGTDVTTVSGPHAIGQEGSRPTDVDTALCQGL